MATNIDINMEIVIGLVAPVGTNLDLVETCLSECLREYSCAMEIIRLSQFLAVLKRDGVPIDLKTTGNEGERINSFMSAGNFICEKAKRKDIFALHAISSIIDRRPKDSANGNVLPDTRVAYILRSLKRPEEIATLRKVYGSAFFLIGFYCNENNQLEYLVNNKKVPKADAKELIKRDAEEAVPFGQKTRNTFSLSDLFIRDHTNDTDKIKKELFRFLDIIFGYPYFTPTKDEFGMYQAYSAALRSGSLARQVGASILSSRGDLIAVGTNDVPSPRGGLYWPDDEDDQRDWQQNTDSNDRERREIIDDVTKIIKKEIPLDISPYMEKLRSILDRSRIRNVTEYGRSVHAEMEAILSCARNGISPVGSTVYATLFCCHNCTKHLIASGIKRVVYTEPYTKSFAEKLHGDAIVIADGKKEFEKENSGKIVFEAFVGIGARRFFDLFAIDWSSGYNVVRKTGEGNVITWQRKDAPLRIPNGILFYQEVEFAVNRDLISVVQNLQNEGGK